MKIESRKSEIENRGLLAVTLAAVALTFVFWRTLWLGGGLVGGDTYSYYYPQKTFYADELHAGRLPLWNSLVGHGYPTMGESQTGVLYPPHLLLFSLLPVNTAYNANQLLHYVLAFVATWLFARRMGLAGWGAALCAVVYVYGWFAPRICLEWAIIGGAYLPLMAWCAESYLQSGRVRWLGVMSVALGVHLLAGHYNLAFIEVLAVTAYAALRLVLSRSEIATETSTAAGPEQLGGSLVLPERRSRLGAWVAVVVALVGGFGLAAVQLAPTWELKLRSQRADVGKTHDPAYGHIPPWYLVQVVTPWMWYAPDVNADEALASIRTLTYPAATNKVEAHLYFGLVPFWLAVVGLWQRWRSGERLPATLRIWLCIGVAAAVYATGWLLPVTRHLPGFSFFIGPGRYGILTTLAVGLLAGNALDRWLARPRAGLVRGILIAGVFGLTVGDFWNVRCHWNRRVDGAPNWYADLVSNPPILHRDESVVRKLLAEFPLPVRMWGTYQNMPTITGFAMTPTYLGLSPAEYLDPQLTIPKPAGDKATPAEVAAQVDWLRCAGVTHILSERPLGPTGRSTRCGQGLMNCCIGRGGDPEPLWLYTLRDGRGRVSLDPPGVGHVDAISYYPERIAVSVLADSDANLVLTDLAYPGWTVTVDGQPTECSTVDGMFRSVPIPRGEHAVEWLYRPRSVWMGAIVSAASAVMLCVGLWIGRRQSRRLG
ncbi:MAG: YfhO family protein [Planctomycetaceae bacterium]